MRRIAPQLADMMARHGLEAGVEVTITGRTRTSYRVPVLLHTATGPVLVDGDLENATVDDGSVLRLYLMAVDCGARALFLHTGDVPASAREFCGDKVTLWPSREAITLLGNTLWASALGLDLPRLPGPLGDASPSIQAAAPAVQTVFAQPEPEVAPQPEAAPEPAPTAAPEPEPALAPEPAAIVGAPLMDPGMEEPEQAPPPTGAPAQDFIDLGDAGVEAPAMDLETGVDVVVTTLPTTEADELSAAQPLTALAPTTVAEALPPAFQDSAAATSGEAPLFEMPPAFRDEGAGPALPVPEGSRGLLPALVTLDEAKGAVSDRLFGIEEWELILQPVHLFDYAVELLRSGSLQADVQRGRIQVNGTDRKVTATGAAAGDPTVPSRVFATPDLTVMDKVLRVTPERAQELANEWATAAHGKTVHVNMAGADDSFDLLERKTVGPTSSQVNLGYLGLWHRPFWRLWGTNGHVDVDAVEGHVLDQELKSVDPDFLLVD